MKVNKSGGPDGLTTNFLTKIKLAIAKPLTYLFNESLNSGIVPEQWKEALVTPLFKKGKKNSVTNYRPISLTSQVGKPLEQIIKNSVSVYLESNNLISEAQHGFRKGKSTKSNLLEFQNVLYKLVDDKKSSGCGIC